MPLVGRTGDSINTDLLALALSKTPCIVLDAANCANPHLLFPFVEFENFKSVYVVQAEIIYTFRDALKELAQRADEIGTKTIIITTFSRLFHYQNERENEDVYDHSWELMKKVSLNYDVTVGVHISQMERAKKYCDVII